MPINSFSICYGRVYQQALLRDVLNNANSYNEAKETLEKTTIASDCLLLLSGIRSNEMTVIERTPKRSATGDSMNGVVCVTNDYKLLENGNSDESELQATSCERYDRACELLRNARPKNSDECLNILQDEKVIMGITVQQMVFDNKSGRIELVRVGGNS